MNEEFVKTRSHLFAQHFGDDLPVPPKSPELMSMSHKAAMTNNGVPTVVPDPARSCLTTLSNRLETLENENRSLKQALESKMKVEDSLDARKDLRRTFDLALDAEFGPETYPGPRMRIKERLGL